MMGSQAIELNMAGRVRAGILASIAVIISLVWFRGALFELVVRWTRQEEYSHGFLIPIITAWLLWTRREALVASIGRPAWSGLLLVLLAIVMHIVGELSAIFVLPQVGFIIALFGIILAFGGYSLLKVTFAPIIFLLFAIPLPYFIDAHLTLRLQLISSEIGAFFTGLLGIPVYLQGNILDLGAYKLAVVEACSGLRYLFPLLSLGFLAAYLFRAPVWQRALVFLSAIPITILMNSARIALTAWTMDRWGSKMADEVLHAFEGWIIFMACAALLALLILVLARLSGKTFFEVFDVPAVPVRRETIVPTTNCVPVAAFLIILCAAGLSIAFISGRTEIVPDRARFASFPTRIGQWQGHVSSLDAKTERGLGVDDYVLSDFDRSDGRLVNLYVAYYASQRKGVSSHSPSVCIPGGGWLITRTDRATYDSNGVRAPVNRVIVERNSEKQLVYYWFVERGRQVADEYLAKVYLLADAITMNRTDGALVRLTTPVLPGETEQGADNRLQSFMRDVVPSLITYLPAQATPRPTLSSTMTAGQS